MSPELLYGLLMTVVAGWALYERHDYKHDWLGERGQRLRLQAEKAAEWSLRRRVQVSPWQRRPALPAVRELPVPAQQAKDVLALETAGLAFTDPPTIDAESHTVEHTLPVVPEPIDPTKVPVEQRRFLPPLPPWPGEKKENARAN